MVDDVDWWVMNIILQYQIIESACIMHACIMIGWIEILVEVKSNNNKTLRCERTFWFTI